MPVIINDFEVTAEIPRQGTQQGTPSAPGPTGVQPAEGTAGVSYPPNPLDIQTIEEHQARRWLRLWAH